jgi:carbonic anhydrase/acetyltransferase-like protein (isoleucine patch superfamily)
VNEDTIVGGVPAKEITRVNDDFKSQWTDYKKNYQSFCVRYKNNLKEKK